jgi:hypothetical protein
MKTIAFLVAVFLIGAAHAADWKTIYDTSSDSVNPLRYTTVEVDTSSVIFKQPYVQAWIRTTVSPAQQFDVVFQKKDFLSTLELEHFDCVNKEYAISQSLYYTGVRGTGDNIGSRNNPKDSLPKYVTTVAPDTLGELILNSVCSIRSRKK